VIVCFVDIGGIVDHHCLNLLFLTLRDKLSLHRKCIITDPKQNENKEIKDNNCNDEINNH
jgi:hypothetical protein